MDVDPDKDFEANGAPPPDWKLPPYSQERLNGRSYYPRQLQRAMRLVLHNHQLRMGIRRLRKKYDLPVDLKYTDDRADPNRQLSLGGDKAFALDIRELLAKNIPPISPVFGGQIKEWALNARWFHIYHPRPAKEADKDRTYEGSYLATLKENRYGTKRLEIAIYNRMSPNELGGLVKFIKDYTKELPPVLKTNADIPFLSEIADLDRLYVGKRSGKNQTIANLYNKKHLDKPINNERVTSALKSAKKLHL